MISQCFLGSLLRYWIKISHLKKPASPLYSSLIKLHKKPQYLYCEYVCVMKCVLLFLLWGAMENGFSDIITAFAESTLFSSARHNLAMMHGKSTESDFLHNTPKRFHLCLVKHIKMKHAELICLEPNLNIGHSNKHEQGRYVAFSDRKRTKGFLSLPSDCIYIDWRSLANFRKVSWMAIVAWSEWLSPLTVLLQSTETQRQTCHSLFRVGMDSSTEVTAMCLVDLQSVNYLRRRNLQNTHQHI